MKKLIFLAVFLTVAFSIQAQSKEYVKKPVPVTPKNEPTAESIKVINGGIDDKAISGGTPRPRVAPTPPPPRKDPSKVSIPVNFRVKSN